jgi:hypothetical protein
VATRSITRNGGRYDCVEWLKDYVAFMTTPGSHNDTYAESFHRDFFANFARGVPPEECSRNTEGHNTAQIGGFVVRSCAFLLHACRGAQPAVFSWTLECGHAMPSGMWEIQHAVSSSVRAKHLVCLALFSDWQFCIAPGTWLSHAFANMVAHSRAS